MARGPVACNFTLRRSSGRSMPVSVGPLAISASSPDLPAVCQPSVRPPPLAGAEVIRGKPEASLIPLHVMWGGERGERAQALARAREFLELSGYNAERWQRVFT